MYDCPDLTEAGRPSATLTITGDSTYDAEKQVFRDHRTQSETIRFRGGDGGEQELRNIFAYPENFVIGRRMVKHTIRYPIRQSG